jgi:transposase
MIRKKYPQEFKEEAIKLSQTSGKSVARVAADLGLPVNVLYRWCREAQAGKPGKAFSGVGKARDEELTELRKRLKQAETERDILKKAVSFFAQQPQTK